MRLDLASISSAEPSSSGDVDLELARLIEVVRGAFEGPDASPARARDIAALAVEAATAIRRRRDQAEIERLKSELEAHQALVKNLFGSIRRTRARTEAALASARSGIFECRLRDGRLEWTPGVYDMFGFPQGAALRRDDVVGCYTPASLAALDALRDNAISNGKGFSLDAEIVSAKAARRWIRISATVERTNGRSTRLVGMKQDVTEARAMADDVLRSADLDGAGFARVG